MDAKVSKLLNEQINKEFYSAYLYLDMANFYNAKGLDGFSNWFEIQGTGILTVCVLPISLIST